MVLNWNQRKSQTFRYPCLIHRRDSQIEQDYFPIIVTLLVQHTVHAMNILIQRGVKINSNKIIVGSDRIRKLLLQIGKKYWPTLIKTKSFQLNKSQLGLTNSFYNLKPYRAIIKIRIQFLKMIKLTMISKSIGWV